eukprot:5162279-Pleurochrysis_carterae.AAC.3
MLAAADSARDRGRVAHLRRHDGCNLARRAVCAHCLLRACHVVASCSAVVDVLHALLEANRLGEAHTRRADAERRELLLKHRLGHRIRLLVILAADVRALADDGRHVVRLGGSFRNFANALARHAHQPRPAVEADLKDDVGAGNKHCGGHHDTHQREQGARSRGAHLVVATLGSRVSIRAVIHAVALVDVAVAVAVVRIAVDIIFGRAMGGAGWSMSELTIIDKCRLTVGVRVAVVECGHVRVHVRALRYRHSAAHVMETHDTKELRGKAGTNIGRSEGSSSQSDNAHQRYVGNREDVAGTAANETVVAIFSATLSRLFPC